MTKAARYAYELHLSVTALHGKCILVYDYLCKYRMLQNRSTSCTVLASLDSTVRKDLFQKGILHQRREQQPQDVWNDLAFQFCNDMELNAIAINDTYNELQNTKQGEGGGKISAREHTNQMSYILVDPCRVDFKHHSGLILLIRFHTRYSFGFHSNFDTSVYLDSLLQLQGRMTRITPIKSE